VARYTAMISLVLSLAAAGCTCQPNSGSQAVEINPCNWGSGQQVVGPADNLAQGYMNGEPLDARRR